MDPNDDPEIDDTREALWRDELEPFEIECFDELQSEPNLEEKLITERNIAEQQIFLNFQASATAIAQLYRGEYSSCYFAPSIGRHNKI